MGDEIFKIIVREVSFPGGINEQAADSPGYAQLFVGRRFQTSAAEVLILRAAFLDQVVRVEDQIAEGDRVVNRITASGTHLGEFMGRPPTGRQITVCGITIDRVVQGRLQESWTCWDLGSVLQQMRVAQKTAS